MSDITNQNTEPLFIFDMPDEHLLSETISVKGEKGERGDPTKLSDLENDEGFINANTDALVNYYTKSETDAAIDAAVDELNVPDGFFADGGVISDKGTSITLEGTASSKIKDVKLYGDTGQSATPSPNNYVPIKVATGRQAITIGSSSYEINLGKNLFDKNTAVVINGYINGSGTITGSSSNTNRTVFIPCEPNTTYTVQKGLQGTTSSNRFRLGTSSEVPSYGTTLSDYWNAGDGATTKSHTITTASNARYLVAYVYKSDDATPFDKILLSIQIEKGTTASDYSRYFTPMELAAVNNQEDNIFSQDDKWYKHRAVAKVTFTGADSESWSFESNVDSSGFNRAIIALGDNYVGSGRQAILSDHFKAAASGGTHAEGIGFTSGTALYLYPDASIASVEEFKTWLASHPTTVYYALATTSDDQITRAELIAELDALKQAQTSAGTTSISVLGVLPVKLYAEAYADNYNGDQTRDTDDIAGTYTKAEVDGLINDKVRFIFPKFWPSIYSGDCNLIKYQNKNILIDCQNTPAAQYVLDMLSDNDVAHIDVFICSHYHGDHIGNFENLVKAGLIDADTKLFMPAETTNFGWSSQITQYKNMCATYDLAYYVPFEGETYTIGDLKMTFNNCDAEAMDEYYTAGTDSQNDTSTVVLIEHRNVKAYYTGDIGTAAERRLDALNFPSSSVELYKMAHHGINSRTRVEYIRKLAPEYAVQPSGIMDDVKNNYGTCEQTAVLRGIGTRIYPTHRQKDYLVFTSDGSAVQCEQGKPYGASDQAITMTYYVDKTASTTDIQDGSQEHPFRELMQAISAIPFKSGMTVSINVAAGYYGNAHESSTVKNTIYINTGKDVRLTINGDAEDTSAVVLNGVMIVRSTVTLNNLSVDIDRHNGIYTYGSDVYLSGVNVKSYTDTLSTTYSGIILRQNSYMQAIDTRIEQCNECIIATQGSKFSAYGTVSIGSHNSRIVELSADSILITGTHFSFDSDTDKLDFTEYNDRRRTPVQIMAAHESYAQTIDLVASASKFSWIEIQYRTNDGNYGSTGRIYSPNGKSATAIVPLLSGSGVVYNKQCKFVINGSTISITQSLQIVINGTDAPTITQNDTYFDIVQVVGSHYSEVIDISS